MDGFSNCDLAGILLGFHRRVYLDGQRKVGREKAARIRNVIRQVVGDCEEITWEVEDQAEG